MEVGKDLKNVYIHADAKILVPLLMAAMTQEGKRGRKYAQMSLGDTVSEAIREACANRGITLTPARIGGDPVVQVPVVSVRGKVRAK